MMRLPSLYLYVFVFLAVFAIGAASTRIGSADEVVEVNGIRLHYEDVGEGEVLLLLHSGTQTSRMWDGFVDEFSERYRLIVPDLRGHGGSTNPEGIWSTRRFAADIFALLDRLGIDRFKAIGASIGGMTLLQMATLEPDRIEAMVVIGVGTNIPVECRNILASVDADTLDEEAWEKLRAVHPHGDQQIRNLYAWVASLADSYRDTSFAPPLLATIKARTLVVHGDSDYCFPPSMALMIYESIPDAKLWVVPNGSHVPIGGTNADVFARITLDFLSTVAAQQIEKEPQSTASPK